MPINNIPNVQFIWESDRCHPHVLDFVVATASIGSYLSAYHGQPVTSFAPIQASSGPQYPTCSYAGQASGRTVKFVPDDVLRAAFLRSTRNEPIPYLVEPSFVQISGVTTTAVAETYEGLAQAMFTRFWETNLSSIEAVHGLRKAGNWPTVLRFAAVVRDAMSHGGTLHMFPAVQPVTHFGLTYDSSQNGRKIIHNDLSCADIFFLMLEADALF